MVAKSWFVICGSVTSLIAVVSFAVWTGIHPKFPTTLWYGEGCILFRKTSAKWGGDDLASERIHKLLADNEINLNASEWLYTEGTSPQLQISGFLKARTVKAARTHYAETMREIRSQLVEINGPLGFFDAESCGLAISLPANLEL